MTDRPVRIAHCAGWLWDRFSGLRDALAGPVVVTVGLLAERFDHGWAHATAGRTEEHRYLDPETVTADTGLGARVAMTRRAVLVLLLALLAGCGTTPPPPTTAAPAPFPAPDAPARPAPGAPVVVLDPGHNGGNAGAADEIAQEVPDGRGGTKPCNTTGTATSGRGIASGYAEHAFAFDVARRVTRVLTERGVVVRSTRSDDAGVGPCVDRRAATANDARAALTVSIHADSAPAADDRGFHVAVADPALAPSQRGPSLDLARALIAGLEGRGFTPSTYRGEGGLDPRPDLAGLNLARVPAALVECANMRNPDEAAVVTDPAGRQRYADGIAAGILQTLGR